MFFAVSKAAQNCTALHTLLMTTAESNLSKRPVLRITAAFFFLQLFFSHIYCITIITIVVAVYRFLRLIFGIKLCAGVITKI